HWYGAPDQVPTGNYLSVEAEGAVRPLSREETVDLLDALAVRFEGDLAPAPPWTRAEIDPARFQAMVDHISGFEMRLERFEGIRKLSQNKPPDQIRRVADHLAGSSDAGAREIARLMRELST
ncbi:MAG: FMN-binding negative transcriptional regulator, partial [Caulobacteraceae bacterium]